jgi:hypothetical protein
MFEFNASPDGVSHRRFFSSTKTQKHTFPARKKVPFLVSDVQGLDNGLSAPQNYELSV